MRKSINWKTHCFFCGGVCVVDKRHHNGSKGWHKVDVFLSFQTSILNKCYERAEKCTDDVLRRFSSSIDVDASDAIYHEHSESIFFYGKCISTTNGTKSEHTVGHTADNIIKSNFETLCKWIDEQTEMFTVSELHAKMSLSAEKDLYVKCL